MKKKFFLLPCIAAVAFATVVGTKAFKSNADESNELLMANVEALSQQEESSLHYLVFHYPCYDWVYYNGQLVSFANGKYKANSNRCDECSGYYHAHACSLCQSAK